MMKKWLSDPRFIYTAINSGLVKIPIDGEKNINVYVKGRHRGFVKKIRQQEINVNFIVGFPYIIVKKENGIEVCGAWYNGKGKIRKTVILTPEICKQNLKFKSKY